MNRNQLDAAIAAGAKTAAEAAQMKHKGYIIGLSVDGPYVIRDGKRVKVAEDYNPGPAKSERGAA